ncbi:MAG: hypothetical protein U0670_23345 [Anaerolineae bacterium]
MNAERAQKIAHGARHGSFRIIGGEHITIWAHHDGAAMMMREPLGEFPGFISDDDHYREGSWERLCAEQDGKWLRAELAWKIRRPRFTKRSRIGDELARIHPLKRRPGELRFLCGRVTRG